MNIKKLSTEDEKEICSFYSSGTKVKDIAKKFNVCRNVSKNEKVI